MDDRRALGYELDEIQQQMKDLEIHYEQYFAGVEKREPVNARKNLARRIRHYTNRRIVWTDLKFRYQGIASRFMTYSQYWDRILRLIDEGRYHRHTARLNAPKVPDMPTEKTAFNDRKEADRLQKELAEARKVCGIKGDAPTAEKVASFLDSQREKIRERYGDRAVVFSIDSSDGKPRIKVSLKK
ncbi:MXAN_5187 C-terminal domain-containing protein [Malonomonas rubra]|uniref:MXAN_5187 C-terminal domain-containing protein n=1 Tax=Malonomonas rubra TaxID=57040 RepID=UPI0026EB5852|nr:MXAN_5187 C-terminal domain-containing protein [Malonomonas rubra]